MPHRLEDHIISIRLGLRPGEEPVLLPDATYLVGDEVVIGRPAVLGDETDLDLLPRLPDEYLVHTFTGLMHGESLVGYPGSLAAGLRRALEPPEDGGEDGFLLVTDQRLLVIDTLNGEPDVLWECELRHIAAARHTPRIFQAGRVITLFVDGSGIGLVMGVLSRKDAISFVEEITRVPSTLDPE